MMTTAEAATATMANADDDDMEASRREEETTMMTTAEAATAKTANAATMSWNPCDEVTPLLSSLFLSFFVIILHVPMNKPKEG